MTEHEMMERIAASAESIQIPEGLLPGQVALRLAEDKEGRPGRAGRRAYLSKAVTAAAVFLVCGIGIFATCRLLDGPGAPSGAGDGQNRISADDAAQTTENRGGQDAAGEREDHAVQPDAGEQRTEPKADAGELYVVAENYGEVYDLLEQEAAAWGLSRGEAEAAYDMVFESAKEEMTTDSALSAPAIENPQMAVSDSVSGSDSGSADYSKTNVVTQGVDESDIIKTDGSYLYILHGNKIRIIDIRGESMKEAGEIAVAADSAYARVMEMYVDNNVLNLILERQETQLRQQEQGEDGDPQTSGTPEQEAGDAQASVTSQTQEASAGSWETGDVYYMDSSVVTELLTYEISDKSSPVLKGSVVQDGSYKTSRKIGDMIYIFSDESMGMAGLTRGGAVSDEAVPDWIPAVNGRAVAADCIYLPEKGSNGLIIASVDVKAPQETVDQILILNNYVEIYVSSGAIYLYHSEYSGSGVTTQIAKFSMRQGEINAAGAASAAGEVYDTFAIQEQSGKLRLLTTDWSRGDTENQLYLFDEDLKLTGSLEGIAEGEQIYAARFIGNTAYFVTYRNMDPLFAVDLSDETNPKILSELKITGFSEYLHLWGDKQLFGIGYETDPDTGERKGVKLTMFDISDPSEPGTAGVCVIGNIDYSPALYRYKCVLADPDENLIGFAAESYGNGSTCSYLLFSWEDGKFRELLTESLGDDTPAENYRGIYVGGRFYLVSPGEVMSYDRADGYRRTERLTF